MGKPLCSMVDTEGDTWSFHRGQDTPVTGGQVAWQDWPLREDEFESPGLFLAEDDETNFVADLE